MLKTRKRAAEMVVEHLAPAEEDVDNAISSLMALSVAMMSAISSAKLPHVLAQGAFDSLGEAVALMFQVRSKVIDTHHRLNAAKDEIGLRAVSFGTWHECPPMAVTDNSAIAPNLKVVSSAA